MSLPKEFLFVPSCFLCFYITARNPPNECKSRMKMNIQQLMKWDPLCFLDASFSSSLIHFQRIIKDCLCIFSRYTLKVKWLTQLDIIHEKVKSPVLTVAAEICINRAEADAVSSLFSKLGGKRKATGRKTQT